MRAAQQLAAQGGSAFDRTAKSFDNQGAIFGVGLDVKQPKAAVDDSQQIANIMCVGLRRVAFDLWGVFSGKSKPEFLQRTPVILPSAPSSGTSTQAPDGRSRDCRTARPERSIMSS